MRKPSGFDPAPDTTDDDRGMLTVLMGAVVVSALASGTAEAISLLGVPVPHAVTVLMGIFIGMPVGIAAHRILRKKKSD